MSTAAYEVSGSIGRRIRELRILLTKAENYNEDASDEESYNILCRACSVLLASHIEGFIKDITNSVRADLNFFVKDFEKMPKLLKRTFCEKIVFYEAVPPGEIEKRVTKLVEFFDKNSVAIDFDAFTYKENVNKNSSPNNIEKSFDKFGVKGVLSAIDTAKFTCVFDGNPSICSALMKELDGLRANLLKFPYEKLDDDYFRLPGHGSLAADTNTMWHTYLEEIISRRHKIVHGDTLENLATVKMLNSDVDKAEVLMHAIMHYFCGAIVHKKVR